VSRQLDVLDCKPETIFIGPGLTLAILINPIANQCSTAFKFFAGTSLLMIGATLGTTLSASSLAALGLTQMYQIDLKEVFAVDGALRFYLAAQGSTATVCLFRGKTSNG
jgi:hypothetical protein